jgi:hypothetical protein
MEMYIKIVLWTSSYDCGIGHCSFAINFYGGFKQVVCMFIVCVSSKCFVSVSSTSAASHGYRDLRWGLFFFCIFGGGEEIELASSILQPWPMVMGGSNASVWQ